ncbi:MAG TPA: MASE1 domain-containing protein, partial [Hyphomicrobiaceae bacterium]|nr:MASE1 domain-containing protein [Hyphomicrobiaceae bacterium]
MARIVRLPDAVTGGAALIVYLGLEWVSFIHEHNGVPVTPWNPGLGVVFALLVLKGAAYGLVLLVGVAIAELFVLQTKIAWPVVLAVAALVSASYAAAAALARQHLRLDVGLSHVRDVLVLLGAGALGAAISAALLSALLVAAGELRASDLMHSATPLLVGDIIGIAVIAPLLLRLSLRWRDLAWDSIVRLMPELLLCVLVTSFALWMIVGSDRPNNYKYFSLLFLPVVAAAVRHGIDGSCLALAATQLGLVALLHRYGYDVTAFTEFQIVMFALTASGLLVGVVVSERQQAASAAREAEARLKELQAEAAQAARMTVVSGMASALAHEINQPITAARALARSAQHMLRSAGADTERVDGHLTNVVAQIDHVASVVRRIREFLRRGQPHFSTLDVRAVLDEALMLARPEAVANAIRIVSEIEDALPVIFGDRVQLQQVILNLVHNAVEAIAASRRRDGRIGIR